MKYDQYVQLLRLVETIPFSAKSHLTGLQMVSKYEFGNVLR